MERSEQEKVPQGHPLPARWLARWPALWRGAAPTSPGEGSIEVGALPAKVSGDSRVSADGDRPALRTLCVDHDLRCKEKRVVERRSPIFDQTHKTGMMGKMGKTIARANPAVAQLSKWPAALNAGFVAFGRSAQASRASASRDRARAIEQPVAAGDPAVAF